MEKELIQQSINQSNQTSISHDEEQYILTHEEEETAIAYAKKKYLQHSAHKMVGVGMTAEQIERKVGQLDLSEVFTPEKCKEILATCNANMHQQIWHEQQRKARIQEESERCMQLTHRCDAIYFFNMIKYGARNEGKKLIQNDQTLHYLKTLCFYFSNDARFETELNFDRSKGLWVRGGAGVGKTYPLQLLEENELNPFRVMSMIEIAGNVSEEGEYELTGSMCVIDDVGSEQPLINHYGTKINWFKDFIEMFYASKKSFSRIIITTNCDFDEIENKYGFRVRSRIKDMFNIINIKGEDLRGK